MMKYKWVHSNFSDPDTELMLVTSKKTMSRKVYGTVAPRVPANIAKKIMARFKKNLCYCTDATATNILATPCGCCNAAPGERCKHERKRDS